MQSRKWHPLAGSDIPRHVNNQAKREPDYRRGTKRDISSFAILSFLLPQLLRETDYRILPVMSVICSLRSFTGGYKTASIDETTRHAATFKAAGAARSTAAPQPVIIHSRESTSNTLRPPTLRPSKTADAAFWIFEGAVNHARGGF